MAEILLLIPSYVHFLSWIEKKFDEDARPPPPGCAFPTTTMAITTTTRRSSSGRTTTHPSLGCHLDGHRRWWRRRAERQSRRPRRSTLRLVAAAIVVAIVTTVVIPCDMGETFDPISSSDENEDKVNNRLRLLADQCNEEHPKLSSTERPKPPPPPCHKGMPC